MSDLHRQVMVTYAEIGIANPLSFATLDRVLDKARLAPGSRVLDLGCGNGEIARHLARRHAADVEAVERSPGVYAIARARTEGFSGPGTVRLHNAGSRDFLPAAEPFDLIVALGVSGVVEGPPEPERVLAALRPHLNPGGWLLWGEAFLKRPPSEAFAAAVAPYSAYRSNAEYVAAAEAAGFTPMYAAVSPDADWDAYVWETNLVTERWLAAHPDDPEAEPVRQRLRFLRAIYLVEGRDTLAFGLYLLRAPG